jgi:hypothetical protein
MNLGTVHTIHLIATIGFANVDFTTEKRVWFKHVETSASRKNGSSGKGHDPDRRYRAGAHT